MNNNYGGNMDNNAELQNRQFHVKYDNRELTIDELKPLFTEAGYICAGHGTGRSGNGDEVVNSIFEKGLRTKDNSFCFTSILLSTPTPELIEQNKELGINPPTISSLMNDLNNWEHKKSKKIIKSQIPSCMRSRGSVLISVRMSLSRSSDIPAAEKRLC